MPLVVLSKLLCKQFWKNLRQQEVSPTLILQKKNKELVTILKHFEMVGKVVWCMHGALRTIISSGSKEVESIDSIVIGTSKQLFEKKK